MGWFVPLSRHELALAGWREAREDLADAKLRLAMAQRELTEERRSRYVRRDDDLDALRGALISQERPVPPKTIRVSGDENPGTWRVL